VREDERVKWASKLLLFASSSQQAKRRGVKGQVKKTAPTHPNAFAVVVLLLAASA